MIRDQIMQIAQSDPRFAQAVEAMERAVINMPIVPEDLDDAIEILELIVQDPRRYDEIREAAIEDGEIDEDVLPPQFDPVYVVSLLVALYGLQDRLKAEGYARGGLAVAARKLAAMGRNGDTELAHITRDEAEMLRRAGGSGTINPNTGLPEYFKLKKLKLGKVLAAVAPIALSFIAPGIGTAIGGAISGGLGLGLGATGSAILGGAALGAGLGAVTGGTKGALTGAVTGGLGSGLGGVIGSAIPGLGLTGPMANVVGSSLVGAGLAGATGRNPLSGALRGALGAGAGELAGAFGQQITGMGPGAGNEALGRGVSAAGTGFGSALAAGMDPRAAAVVGGLSGLAAGMVAPRPSQAVVENIQGEVPLATPVQQPDGTLAPAPGSRGVMPDGRPGVYQLNPQTGVIDLQAVPGGYAFNPQTNRVEFAPQQQQPGVMDAIRTAIGLPAAAPAAATAPGGQQQGGGGLLGSLGGIGPLLAGGALLMGSQQQQQAPQQVQQAVRTLPASQQEYINRPGQVWDWTRMQNDASASGLTLDQYMARNWPRITAGEYNVRQMAEGGLSAVSRFVRGGGTGRSDEIPAKLSDGEYVIDAETVAMLGDGSSKAGAQRLDEMREKVRQHKGKVLAKGKFSPNAKSPLTYLKGAA